MSETVPAVLVHGLWHGSWCWSLVAEELAARRVSSVAVDLEGHGLRSRAPSSRWTRPFDPGAYATEASPVAGVSASSAAATLVRQLERIGNGGPCVLVAHSMGGVVATIAAEQRPDLVSHLVYVAAFTPTGGRAATDYILDPAMGDIVQNQLCADPVVVGALRYDLGDPAVRDVARRTFFGDLEPQDADGALMLFTPDGPVGIPGEPVTVTRERYGSLPHSYVMCRQDRVIRPVLQQRFVCEIDAVSSYPTAVTELNQVTRPQ